MSNYFKTVSKKLILKEYELLGLLYDSQSTSTLSAINRNEIEIQLGISTYKMNLSLHRLVGLDLIDYANGTRNSNIFLKPYGIKMIEEFLNKEEGVC
ncbi:hypothetical protein ACU3L3_06910 [Priestia endophytica]